MRITLAWRIAAILMAAAAMAVVAAGLALVPTWHALGVLAQAADQRLAPLRKALAEDAEQPKPGSTPKESRQDQSRANKGSGVPGGPAAQQAPGHQAAARELFAAYQQWLARQTEGLRRWGWGAGLGAAGFALLAVALNLAVAALLFGKVFGPLRRLVFRTGEFSTETAGTPADADDELAALNRRLDALLSHVADVQASAANSRARMLDAEKLAVVGKLAAGVAHEIRNPLASIRMWLYSLRKGLSDQADALRKLAVVEEEVGRLEKIVQSFLAFSRPAEPRPRPEDPATLLRSTVDLLAHTAAEKQVTLLLDIPPQLPKILADPEQIRQVVINLLNNALEATPAGGWIRIAAEPQNTRHGPGVLFRVRDSGSGIAPEVRSRLFEPFVSTKEHGTGLGLCIAARLVEQHDGWLVLESTGAEGSTFSFWIPAAPEGAP